MGRQWKKDLPLGVLISHNILPAILSLTQSAIVGGFALSFRMEDSVLVRVQKEDAYLRPWGCCHYFQAYLLTCLFARLPTYRLSNQPCRLPACLTSSPLTTSFTDSNDRNFQIKRYKEGVLHRVLCAFDGPDLLIVRTAAYQQRASSCLRAD